MFLPRVTSSLQENWCVSLQMQTLFPWRLVFRTCVWVNKVLISHKHHLERFCSLSWCKRDFQRVPWILAAIDQWSNDMINATDDTDGSLYQAIHRLHFQVQSRIALLPWNNNLQIYWAIVIFKNWSLVRIVCHANIGGPWCRHGHNTGKEGR